MDGPEDARAFKELNEEWISGLFVLEPADRRILDDPEGAIVARGGQVLIARQADPASAEILGCVALVPSGAAPGTYELSKMTVAPAHRGAGVGRAILLAALEHARRLGGTRLFLGSSRRLADAVHLYESVGFRHVPVSELGPLPYARADVFMVYDL